MAINNIGGTGGIVFGNLDSKSLPLQVLTQLVLAETMLTREAEQQQKVEEIAAQNAKAKQYNDALAEISRLAEAFKSDAGNTDKRGISTTDNSAIGTDDMASWKTVAETSLISVLNPTTGKYEHKTLYNVSFEDRLNMMSTTSKPPITDAAKEALRSRARVADMAQSFGMLSGGKFDQGNTYANVAYGDLTKGTMETLKVKLRTAAEAISTNNQLEMIKLQQLIGAVDASKTALSQYAKTAMDGNKEIVQKW